MIWKAWARLVLGIFFCFLMLAPFGAVAQTKIQGLVVNADNSDRDMDTDTIELSGHVQVKFNSLAGSDAVLSGIFFDT